MAPQFQVEQEEVGKRAAPASTPQDWSQIRSYIEQINDCTEEEKERLTLYAFSELPRNVRRQMTAESGMLSKLGFHGASSHTS